VFQSDIHLVLAELQRLRGELASRLLQRARKVQLQKLDRVLDEQARVGAILLPMLRSFLGQYDALSRASVAALHRVPLDGVTMGAGGAAAVSRSLAHAGERARALSAAAQPHLASFESLRAASTGLRETLAAEVSEVSALYDLVRQAWTLESQERALRIDDMQRGKARRMQDDIIASMETLQAKAFFKY